jgi:transposase
LLRASALTASRQPSAGYLVPLGSRDKRPDCVQVVIALVVTPEGFPLAYEVLPGNTAEKTTLRSFLQKIETQYGKAERIWVMDRGIPTEEGELYVLAQSRYRIAKERSMRMRALRGLTKRLKELHQMNLKTKDLLLKLGEAHERYRAAWRLFDFPLPEPRSGADQSGASTFSFRLNRKKLRQTRRPEGRYLLRSNLCGREPADLWNFYIHLTEIESAFRTLKDDLDLRPIYHQLENRIEAHIFVSFMAYCPHLSLRAQLRPHAPGLTSRAVLDKFAAIQMLDVHFPTTDGRTLILSRYTQPEADQKLLLEKLKLDLPDQPPPRITTAGTLQH